MINIDETARAQFRLDTNCPAKYEDEYRIMINPSARIPGARSIDGISDDFRAIIYKGDLYMMASGDLYDWAFAKYKKTLPEWFCKFPNLRELDQKLQEYGLEIDDTHVYLLPDPSFEEFEMECPYEVRFFDEEGIKRTFRENNPFKHAFCFSKLQPDVIGAVAYDDGQPIAASGASLDGKYMRQIGIDVARDYEHHGLAVYLVTLLKNKILDMGLLPFYGTSESHSISLDTAIRCGFLPAWCEIYTKRQS